MSRRSSGSAGVWITMSDVFMNLVFILLIVLTTPVPPGNPTPPGQAPVSPGVPATSSYGTTMQPKSEDSVLAIWSLDDGKLIHVARAMEVGRLKHVTILERARDAFSVQLFGVRDPAGEATLHEVGSSLSFIQASGIALQVIKDQRVALDQPDPPLFLRIAASQDTIYQYEDLIAALEAREDFMVMLNRIHLSDDQGVRRAE